MFENLDFSKMSDLVKDVQEKAKEFELEFSSKEFSSKSGGGLVKVSANGKGEIIDISVDDSLLEDKESLQILLITAVNNVLNLVNQNKQNMVGNILGGFNL